jgi:hypothetical protein
MVARATLGGSMCARRGSQSEQGAVGGSSCQPLVEAGSQTGRHTGLFYYTENHPLPSFSMRLVIVIAVATSVFL